MSIQQKFSQQLRGAEYNSEFMNIETRRMNIYRELVYNNIEGILANGLPVIYELYTSKHWHKMVRDFITKHRCTTPYFHKVVEEFIDYLANERGVQPEDPPGLLELAHYEWAELALSIATDETDYSMIDSSADFLNNHPVVSPLAWSLCYQYPVHKMGVDYLPDTLPEVPSYLVVYRNNDNDIKFMEITPVVSHMLARFCEEPGVTAYEVLLDMARALHAADIELFVESGLQSLHQLHARGIILGINN